MNVASAAFNRLRIDHLKLIELLIGVGSLHKAAKSLSISQPRASACASSSSGAGEPA